MGRGIIRQKHLQAISIASNGIGALALTLFGVRIPDNGKVLVAEFILGLGGIIITPLVTSFMQIESEAVSAALEERQRAVGFFAEVTHKLLEVDPAQDLRVTIMEVSRDSDPFRLRQVVRCSCKGQVTPGRTGMSIHQGVAGRCYVKGKNVTFNVPKGSDFIQHMLDFGFLESEARQFHPRGAYLCSPIFDTAGDQVVAVLALDTAAPDTFTPSHTELTEWLTPFFSKFLGKPDGKEA